MFHVHVDAETYSRHVKDRFTVQEKEREREGEKRRTPDTGRSRQFYRTTCMARRSEKLGEFVRLGAVDRNWDRRLTDKMKNLESGIRYSLID